MDLNSLNSMKVTDLKKELKSRGLSIVGNKSELMARLLSVLTEQDSQGLNENEDSVLNEEEDEILGSDLLDGGSEGDGKTDEALIDDLLDNSNENNLLTNKPKTQTIPTIKRVTAAAAMTAGKDSNANDNDKSEELSKDKGQIHLSKTLNAIPLTANERKEMRAKKFGDSQLSVRAQRFGLTTKTDSNEAKPVSSTDSGNLNEKLKKRAERFGAIVSDKMKKIDNTEKLLKRKERFGAITTTTDSASSPNTKKAITFSTKDEDRKRQRLERFGVVS